MYFHIPVLLHFVRHFSCLESDIERAVMGDTAHTPSPKQSYWLQNKVTLRVPSQVSLSNTHQKDVPSAVPWHCQPGTFRVPLSFQPRCSPLAPWLTRAGAAPEPARRRCGPEQPDGRSPGPGHCALLGLPAVPTLRASSGNSPWPVLFLSADTAPSTESVTPENHGQLQRAEQTHRGAANRMDRGVWMGEGKEEPRSDPAMLCSHSSCCSLSLQGCQEPLTEDIPFFFAFMCSFIYTTHLSPCRREIKWMIDANRTILCSYRITTITFPWDLLQDL